MGKKKIPHGLDEEDRRFIEEKMYGSKSSDRYSTFSPVNYNFKVSIKCKSQKQKEFLKLLKSEDKIICVGSGSAGTGKSYLTLAAALQILSKTDKDNCINDIRHIVIVVPTNPAGSPSQKIGFLPGTIDDKCSVYRESDTYNMTKILTNSGVLNAKSIIEGLVRNNVIRYEICSFAKGKTFDNSIILLNEAEDYSIDEMLLLCTRIGESSRLWITGDERQCDRLDIRNSKLKMSGLEYLKKKLASLEEFGCVEFSPEDIVRNSIITKILKLWDAPFEEVSDKKKEQAKKIVDLGQDDVSDFKLKEEKSDNDEVVEEPAKKKRGRPKKKIEE